MKRKLIVGDLMFVFQIVMAWLFTGPQVLRSFKSTTGVTITWPAMCLVFLVINIFLAIGAYRKSRSRRALQIVCIYANWIVLMGALLAALMINGHWIINDTVVSMSALVAVSLLITIRWKQTLVSTIVEPITRGFISLIAKSTPQLYIAYCIVDARGGNGLAGMTLFIGHITVCVRIAEIWFAASQDGWNRQNVGLMISESGNELTWWVTTVAWLAYR